MSFIKKQLKDWEVKYGQIQFTGTSLIDAKALFKDYLGITFDLDTPNGSYPNNNFLEDANRLRLACRSFFKSQIPGQDLYIQPIDANTIKISLDEPIVLNTSPNRTNEVGREQNEIKRQALLIRLTEENLKLREQNKELFQYKDRLDKYQNLDFIFKDERAMEDWLENNITKIDPDFEIIDRQITITWKQSFLKNRMDLFVIDKHTKELIVIENKVRGRHRGADTQYLKYNAWIKANLDDINEKYSNFG